MTSEQDILKALVVDWPGAMKQPEIARAVFLKKKSFTDERIRDVVEALVLANGDIHRAVQDWGGHSAAWLSKFVKWCDKVRGGAK
jgi:hypothetical protein